MQPTEAPKDLSSHVRSNVRAALGAKNVSAAEMARRLGWSQSKLAYRLTGRRSFKIEDLDLIAEQLGIPVSRLVGAPVPVGASA
jgi:transcriptional regulator with XRE-family HTH domain